MPHRIRAFLHDEHGQSLILPALLLPILLGAAGLAVNVGSAYVAASRLQTAVDAGALAGATALWSGDSALTAAGSLVTQDDPAAHDISVTCSGGSCTGSSSQVVTVSASASIPAGFASLFGLTNFTPGAQASAKVAPPQAFQYVLFQGDTAPGNSLDLSGSPNVNGNVHSNDNLTMRGNVAVKGSATASGVVQLSGPASCSDGCTSNAPALAMPVWTAAQIESLPGTVIVGSAGDPVNCSITGGSSETMDCGSTSYPINETANENDVIYGNLRIAGDTTYNGSLAVIGGNLTISGNTSVKNSGDGLTLTALSSNGTVGGTGGNITMSGDVSEEGVLYAPDGNVTLNGHSTITGLTGSVVANTITMSGSETITYSASMAAALPQMQATLVP